MSDNVATKYGKKRYEKKNIIYTIITAVLIISLFSVMVSSFYENAEEEAYEMLHIQTKQIKDDLTLQIKSDRENLVTMANFAAKLYADGEGYSLMFESFKPIGMFSNIGILNPDNTFTTRVGTLDLNGKISFYEEAARGEYISGRIPDLTGAGKEIIRSAVPIKHQGKVIGILYGVIHLETIGAKYNKMAKELDAQLFVYDKETGKFLIDTIDKNPGELSELKTREYNEGYSYDDFIKKDKGYTSFKSIHSGENLYVHYSTIEDFDWGILLARYETQVFSTTQDISRLLFVSFSITIFIMAIYLGLVMKGERNKSRITAKTSEIRKQLLEVNKAHGNVMEALKTVCEFLQARDTFFVNTDSEDYGYTSPKFAKTELSEEERIFVTGEIFKYATKLQNLNRSAVAIMNIVPDRHLMKTNRELYELFRKHNIKSVSYAIIREENNHISILGVADAGNFFNAKRLLEDIAICFSIAVYNKKHLNKTEMAATTDSLTGALNRVSYKNDILVLDKEMPEDFSCIYIDVNELHIRNNKYGHAVGDEMLIYIANTLKEVFFGHRVYRMGGDEFLVFIKGTEQTRVKKNIEAFKEQLKPKGYHVSIGTSYRTQNTNCEEMVREAEVRMYEAKAQYYQNKEENSLSKEMDEKYTQVKTGMREIDTMISVLKEHYNGIYRVSLDTDSAQRILMPAYLGYGDKEENFSKLYTKYVEESVDPDFRRAVMSFLNYDAVKRQLAEGKTPRMNYKKVNGEPVTLSVYRLEGENEDIKDTLWVFSK